MVNVIINPNPFIPALPRVTDKTKVDVRYSLIQPFANTHIYWDSELGELIYDIEEPILKDNEKDAIKRLEDAMTELINVNVVTEKTPEKIMEYIDKTAKFLISELNLKIDDESYQKIFYYLYRDFVGLNEVEPLLRDYFIEDIECNGLNTPIYIVHRNYHNIRTTLRFKELSHLSSFVEKLAQRSGKYVSYSEPLLDGTLPDGSIDYNEPLIYRENGFVKTVRIGEFVDRFYKENETNKPIPIEGIDVVAFDKNFKINWKKAQYVYRHKIDEDLYNLELEFGRKVKLTGNHSIFVLRDDGVKSEKTEKLEEGDYVVLPSKIPENDILKEINLAKELSKSSYSEKLVLREVPNNIYEDKKGEIYLYYKNNYKKPNQAYYEHRNKNILPIKCYNLLSEAQLKNCFIGTTSTYYVPSFLKIDENLMWFLGLYIAEGWLYDYNSYGVTFSLNKNEKDLIGRIEKSSRKCFNLNTYVEKPQGNAVKVKVDGIILFLIMKDVLKVSEGAHKKRVPELIWNVSKELQQEFIQAWHAGDYSTTVSEQLANDISYLSLFNEDIVAFYKSKPKKTFIKGREINSNGAYYYNYYSRSVNQKIDAPPRLKSHGLKRCSIFGCSKCRPHSKEYKRVSRKRLVNILKEVRYKKFENLDLASKKFLLEWEKRGFIEEKNLTKNGEKLLEEIKVVQKLIESDFCFSKIKKISRVQSNSPYVYDFSVKGDENFVAGVGGICCHNSRVNATYTQDVTSRGPTFCFKDGYIQLSDGRIKNIKELFNEAKNDFGSKMDGKNEVVETSNIYCTGVEEKDLKQKNSKIKSIIKLSPPEKIAKINFEDGGDIEVTLNHKFHVMDNSLHLVEAKDLQVGMYVPMPKKIDVVGYRQKIDVYSVLKDFSYIKKICIAINPLIRTLVSKEIENTSNNGRYRQVLSEQYGVAKAYFYEIVSRGNSISFQVADELCQNNKVDFSNLGDIEIVVYGGGTKNRSKSIKVPKEINEDLAYLAGILISDGHVSKNYIDFCAFEEGVRDSVKEKLLKIFGKFDSYYQKIDAPPRLKSHGLKRCSIFGCSKCRPHSKECAHSKECGFRETLRHNNTRVYLCNSFVPFFFNKIFGVPFGKKSSIVKIPEVILKSDNVIIASFVKGLFDGDGTVNSGLSYRTYSKSLVEGLTYLLARIGIYSYIRSEYGNGYRLNIPSPYYSQFMELVGFDELKKKEKLKLLVKNQIDYKTFTRHERIPANPFLSIINKLDIPKTKLAKQCNVTFNRFSYPTFSKSFANSLLKEIKKNKNLDIVKDEINSIEWMLKSSQEFVRVKSIEFLENIDHVYDIELEPCTFFVAGNKPMNVFDTIRKFTKVPWTPVQLIEFNTLSPEMLAYFWILVQYKSNIFIAGGTSSGKTTLLNAIAFFIPPEAHVVSIEDTRELNLPHENWIPAVARVAIGTGGVGEIDLFDLLKNSFRQNPNYVIVGEVRGKEAFVLFQGMASGHPSISTMHADSVDTLIKRLETPPIELSPTLVNSLDCVAIMTHAIIKKNETRRLREIVEIINVKSDGVVLVNTPFTWNASQDIFYFKKESKVFEKIAVRYGLSVKELEHEFSQRSKLLYALYQKKIFGFEDVRKIITDYYQNPKKVLQKFGIEEA
ncbi:Flp pilus assembly complex ATPase component TadA [Candidatus Pacearchaeota archaeon]|nr:Flp pilus assembly complex ATPase component TadA [Candidatus Pacearchaeota archaeon]